MNEHDPSTPRRVVHDQTGQAYRLYDGDVELSHAEYREVVNDAGETRWVFHHTYTYPEHRGRGYAEEIVRAALNDVATRGGRVIPRCWVVADVIAATPAYQPLL